MPQKILFPLLLALSVCLDTLFIVADGFVSHKLSVISKTAATFCILCIGLFCLAQSGPDAASILVIAGLGCGMLGDLFLALHGDAAFYTGVCFFFAGHVLYILSFLLTSSFMIALPALGAAAVLCVLMFLLVLRKMIEQRSKRYAMAGYSLFLLWMFCCALLSLIMTKQARFWPACLGAALFCVSDTVLGFMLFGGLDKKFAPVLCMGTYYAAQTCLALSILFT
ncbi:MAG: lysoplasmalogenase [Clostridia bacterium]|nr:lysoplasmalogenase [Clostridia bacterium]